MRVAIIDCYDSFTYNLVQLIGCLGAEPVPVLSDEPISHVRKLHPDRIILSPGPGTPDDSGICPDVVREFAGQVPILGVCLGHQTIIQTFGGKIHRMDWPVHGKTSMIFHTGEGIFAGMPHPFTATRYHSLAVDVETITEEFHTLAYAGEDRCVMAVSHRKLPVFGIQFHPESIMTRDGSRMLQNFLGGGA
ncbi:MAG: aminodeoxychorismate/anthranilate synthase component II [Methanoregulaceae archaeon]